MPHADPTVALGVTWSTWDDTGPSVRLGPPDRAVSELRPLIGLSLNYRVDPQRPRRCLGHVPFRPSTSGGYHDCANPPLAGGRKCDRCAVVDATLASNLHHAHTRGAGELDPDIARSLDRPNMLYLAGFRDGSVKVGTTTESRHPVRLLEQGAWRAVVVGDAADGYAVRRAEDRVTAELGISQSVAIGRKLAGLEHPIDDRLLAARLDADVERVTALLDGDGDISIEPRAWSFPGADGSCWSAVRAYPLPLDRGHHHLDIVDACGRVIVFSRPDLPDRFVADIGQLFGVALELGDHRPDELFLQDSLF